LPMAVVVLGAVGVVLVLVRPGVGVWSSAGFVLCALALVLLLLSWRGERRTKARIAARLGFQYTRKCAASAYDWLFELPPFGDGTPREPSPWKDRTIEDVMTGTYGGLELVVLDAAEHFDEFGSKSTTLVATRRLTGGRADSLRQPVPGWNLQATSEWIVAFPASCTCVRAGDLPCFIEHAVAVLRSYERDVENEGP
jgi:hypothetical protein